MAICYLLGCSASNSIPQIFSACTGIENFALNKKNYNN